jgi:hypothetical protein
MSSVQRRRQFPAYPESIGDSIDIIEPGSNQSNLQDAFIVEAGTSKPIVMLRKNSRSILRQLDDKIEHYTILLRDRRGFVVVLQRRYHIFVQGHATQKLCVRLNSIIAPIGYGYHRCNHLVLVSGQWKIG